MAAGLCYALLIRTWLLVSTDFPINDGGLFLLFIENVARTFPELPLFISYNGLTIPFTYPPLAFWLSAGLARLGVSPLAIVHELPILMNMAYVVMFALLLRRAGYSKLFAAVTVLVFGSSLRSFEWLVMGGGLSRGLGSLFLLATLLLLYRPRRAEETPPSVPRLVLGGSCVAGAVLSHLEWGMLAAALSLICIGLRAPSVRSFAVSAAIIGGTALLLAAPWFAQMYARHGLDPFLSAAGTGGFSIWTHIGIVRSMLGQSSFLLPFVALGVPALFRKREIFWPLFVAAILLVTPRHGPTPMMIPLAVVTTHGVFAAGALLLKRGGSLRRTVMLTSSALLLLIGVRTAYDFGRSENFRPLPHDLRDAMAWVRRNHPDATFMIINHAPWHYDASAEWFPVLAGAVSLMTVQGREWLPAGSFDRTERYGARVKGSRTCRRLFRVMRRFPAPDFFWVEKKQGCFARGGYRRIYANPSVGIWQAKAR